MKQTFDYFEKDSQRFPIVEITLQRGEKQLTIKALVDSGASLSVFNPEIARYLGISVEKGKKIYLTGIGGRILGYIHTVSLSVGRHTFPCKIVFSPEFTVSFNLLGRDNFFEPFVISFFERQRKIALGEAKRQR